MKDTMVKLPVLDLELWRETEATFVNGELCDEHTCTLREEGDGAAAGVGRWQSRKFWDSIICAKPNMPARPCQSCCNLFLVPLNQRAPEREQSRVFYRNEI